MSLLLSRLCWAALALLFTSWEPLPCTASVGNLQILIDNEVAEVGSTIRLPCNLTTFPANLTGLYAAGNIQWSHNGADLRGNWSQWVPDEGGSDLVQENVTIEDSGLYRCCLGSPCNNMSHSASIRVTIGYPPEPASNLRCSCKNFRNVKCTWTRGRRQVTNLPTTEVLQRTIPGNRWRSRRDRSNDGCRSQTVTCNQNICSATCLVGGLRRSYKVKTSNQLNDVFSNVFRFDPDTETIPNPPSHVSARSQSPSSLTVNWRLPRGFSSDLNEFRFLRYCVKYWGEMEGRNNTKTIRDITGDKTSTYTLKNLSQPFGLYYLRVGSYSPNGKEQQCQYSDFVTARTTEIAPRDVPGNFKCRSGVPDNSTAGNTRSARISWESLPNKYMQNGIILGYNIEVHSQKEKERFVNFTVGANKTSYIIKDLAPDEHYEISIRARNSFGLSTASICEVGRLSSGEIVWVVFFAVLSAVVGIILVYIMTLCCIRRYRKISSVKEFNIQLPSRTMDYITTRDNAVTRRAFAQLEPEEFQDPCHWGSSAAQPMLPNRVDSPGADRLSRGSVNSFEIPHEQPLVVEENPAYKSTASRGQTAPQPPESGGAGLGYFQMSSASHPPIWDVDDVSESDRRLDKIVANLSPGGNDDLTRSGMLSDFARSEINTETKSSEDRTTHRFTSQSSEPDGACLHYFKMTSEGLVRLPNNVDNVSKLDRRLDDILANSSAGCNGDLTRSGLQDM